MTLRVLLLATAFMVPMVGVAQTLTGIKIEPAQIKAGESVKITVSFDVEGPINCGLRLHFGDGGNPVDYKINQKKDVPLVVRRTYDKPGEFRLMAETKTVLPLLKCNGKNQVGTLSVAPAPTGKGAKSAKASPQCPVGWNLDKKSVKKSGAYTCHAAPGTRPEKLDCPKDLSYFSNEKKGWIGCKP